MAGVTETGFQTKPLTTIVDEINTSLIAAMGSGFDTTLDTPQGQMVNVFADAQASLWELSQAIYASFDIRQATGSRLDQLGEFRQLNRVTGESDNVYRARLLSPVNPTQAAVSNLRAAVSLVEDVTDVEVYYNATGLATNSSLQPLTISLVVTGGSDVDVATAISDNLVFGLGMIGDTSLAVTGSDNVCRTIRFTRGAAFTFKLSIVTDTTVSTGVCGGTSIEYIKELLVTTFAERLDQPGVLITRKFIEAILIYAGIGVWEVLIDGKAEDLQLAPNQLASLSIDDITVMVGTPDK